MCFFVNQPEFRFDWKYEESAGFSVDFWASSKMGRAPPKKEVPCVHGVFSQFSQHHPLNSENKEPSLGHI